MASQPARDVRRAANQALVPANAWRQTGRRLCSAWLVAGLVVCGSAGTALAQLSSEDIAALRAQGETEGWTFTVGENEATRRPSHELCGLVLPPDWQLKGRFDPCTSTRSLPSSFDWRTYNGCTTIRNQGGCGSCWAFGAIGTLESWLRIMTGASVTTNLSEQWLVSCTEAGSCNGGWHADAYEYLRCGGLQDPCGDSGAVWESDFPYVAYNAPCNCPYPHPYCIDGWAFVGSGTEIPTVNQIKYAILHHGPVVVGVHADYPAFQGYTGGVFNNCVDEPTDHGVVLVGWDNNQGNGVWILRNSWGPGWGTGGYMLIEYGCSRVGYGAAYVDYEVPDCNENNVPDYHDIAIGTSEDCNANGVPDE